MHKIQYAGMNKQIFFVGYILCSLILPMLVHGEVYQWVDQQGQVHFGNVPPKQQGPYKPGDYEHRSPSLDPTVNVPPIQKASDSVTHSESQAESTPVNSIQQLNSRPKTQSKPQSILKPKELDILIKRLRKEAATTHVLPAAIPATQVQQKTEVLQIQNTVENAIPVVVKKKEKVQAEVAATEVNKTVDKATLDPKNEKDLEKCGVFTEFVIAYEAKVIEGCPGAHCSVYKRSLKKYKIKQKQYC